MYGLAMMKTISNSTIIKNIDKKMTSAFIIEAKTKVTNK